MKNSSELSFELMDTVFVEGRGYVGGSVLKKDQIIEFNNARYLVSSPVRVERMRYHYKVEQLH